MGDAEIKHSASQRMKSTHPAPEIDHSMRRLFVALTDRQDYPLHPTDCSSWLKLQRTVAWVNRFIENCKKNAAFWMTGELKADALKKSEIQLVKQAQRCEFQDEWNALLSRRPLSSNSKLLALNPQLDDDGLIWSDGRFTNAKFISYDVRHPVILQRKSWVTKWITKDAHEKGNHAFGTSQTLAVLSARYWFISAREAVHLYESHRVASTPELATNFIDYKQMAGMTTVRKSCYYTVLSRRYALRWIFFYRNIFIFEIYTQQ